MRSQWLFVEFGNSFCASRNKDFCLRRRGAEKTCFVKNLPLLLVSRQIESVVQSTCSGGPSEA